MDYMLTYVSLLNELNANNLADLDFIEKYWVDRVKEYFASKPFKLHVDKAKYLRADINDILLQATEREKEAPGMKYRGAVMQQLVGAKLATLCPEKHIAQFGFSVSDAMSARNADFVIGNVAIHVTTAPNNSLLQKCKENINAGLKPIIVTTNRGIAAAEAFAEQLGIEGRIDLLEIEQFIATNIYEISGFEQTKQDVTVKGLINKYNEIINSCETDLSLQIEID
jgi:hypothetical protein